MTQTTTTTHVRRRDALSWIFVAIGAIGIGAVAWATITGWDVVVHGHPAYAVLLIVAVALFVGVAIAALRGTARRGWKRMALRLAGAVLAVVLIAVVAWLRPYTATEPALAAMESSAGVLVTETATSIVMEPTGQTQPVGVAFQPGALVDARAYAAHLRPLAQAGYPVYITKQPLGIAFLALGGADDARDRLPEVDMWVVGGHSLGGTVAAIEAADAGDDGDVLGLLFYASYPASDITGSYTGPVWSLSGSEDQLATPDDIEASRANLPGGATFIQFAGASHAQFGSYGPQAGDGTPTITNDKALELVSLSSLTFLDLLTPGS